MEESGIVYVHNTGTVVHFPGVFTTVFMKDHKCLNNRSKRVFRPKNGVTNLVKLCL